MPESSIFAANRRQLLAGAAGTLLLSNGWPVAAVTIHQPDTSGASGFDFLHGRWTVRHRKLKARLAGSDEWLEFPGTLDVRPFLGGAGNVDENVIHDPAGTYLASSIRIFTASTGTWSIYWADGRSGGLDKPVAGRFEGRTGRFYNEDELGGRPIRVRFTYEDLGPREARWSQAFSPDGGETWETNWVMDFAREDRS